MKGLKYFVEVYCEGGQYDSCKNSPCPWSSRAGCRHPMHPKNQEPEPESIIDVLYDNRGGILAPLDKEDQMIKPVPLTEEQLDRMRSIFAYGPLTKKPIDDSLIAVGLAEIYDEDEFQDDNDLAVDIAIGSTDAFFDESGSVRKEWIK